MVFVAIFLCMLLIWGVMVYRLLQERNFYRIFGVLMSSFLLYISFELILWSARLPLQVMMVVGLIPVVCVAYGFRLYDHYRQREKVKNDDKYKFGHEA